MSREHRRELAYRVEELRKKGLSQRQMAERLGIARRTVRSLLAEVERRRAEGESAIERDLSPRRTPKASKLDPYVGDIRRWLQQGPNLRATRCHEKLQEAGFCGGHTIVRDPAQPAGDVRGLGRSPA
jgi:transposase